MAHAGKNERTTSGERGQAIACISQHLSRRGRVWLRVQGSSMWPWVRPGDVAILRKVLPREICCGDIVLFARNSRFIVHRIVERCTRDGRNFLVTKGDANPHADGVIAMLEILGRVECIYRDRRRIEFHSREKRALGVLIARISSRTRFWAALVDARRVAIRPARRLLRTLRLCRSTAC